MQQYKTEDKLGTIHRGPVRKIFGILDPLPPCPHFWSDTKSTQPRLLCLLLYPPLCVDVLYEWSLTVPNVSPLLELSLVDVALLARHDGGLDLVVGVILLHPPVQPDGGVAEPPRLQVLAPRQGHVAPSTFLLALEDMSTYLYVKTTEDQNHICFNSYQRFESSDQSSR